MKKVTVIGAGGMAGHVISSYLFETGKYRVQNISHRLKLAPDWITADVERPGEIAARLAEFGPDAVVNCTGVLVKESERDPGMAAYVNGYFPHFLERLGGETKFKLIHFSTDCVFYGDKGAYKETDARDGKGFYAQSKAMGEVINPKDLTIRTSIIGPEIKNRATGLFHWFMSSNGTVNGFAEAFWNGVTTLELARSVEILMEQGASGLYHLVSPEKISKYDLLVMIKDVFCKKDVKIEKNKDLRSDKTLSSTRTDVVLKTPGHKQQLSALKGWMLARKSIYSRYF